MSGIDFEKLECLCDELTLLCYLAVCHHADVAEKVRVLADETSKNPIAIAFYTIILLYGYGLRKDVAKASLLACKISQSL